MPTLITHPLGHFWVWPDSVGRALTKGAFWDEHLRPALDSGLIALTKTLDLADYSQLTAELLIVDSQEMSGQHPHRRWEYALALQAINRWQTQPRFRSLPIPLRHADVGGVGSPFMSMFDQPQWETQIIDPRLNLPWEQYQGPPVHVVTALSVIEHVHSLDDFLDACTRHLLQYGLLVLTFDIWNRPEHEEDTAHFHWMRERIFTPETWQDLSARLIARGFELYGPPDWTYYGDHVYDYSFASLTMVRT